MDITFFNIEDKKPLHDQTCWCEKKSGKKFIGQYCAHCGLFIDKESNLPVHAQKWTLLM